MQPGKRSANEACYFRGLYSPPKCLRKKSVQLRAVPEQMDEQQSQGLQLISPAWPQPPNAAMLRNDFIVRWRPWEAGLVSHLSKKCCLGLSNTQRRWHLAHRHKMLLEVKVLVEQGGDQVLQDVSV